MEKEIRWGEFILDEDRGTKLEIDIKSEPTTKDYLFLIACNTFGACCSVEELWKIADIAYEAYKRELEKGIKFVESQTNKIKVKRIKRRSK